MHSMPGHSPAWCCLLPAGMGESCTRGGGAQLGSLTTGEGLGEGENIGHHGEGDGTNGDGDGTNGEGDGAGVGCMQATHGVSGGRGAGGSSGSCCLLGGAACRVGRSTAQHSTAQHSTAQHSTAQHSTAQHSTAQHSTAQHSTAQHNAAQLGWDAGMQGRGTRTDGGGTGDGGGGSAWGTTVTSSLATEERVTCTQIHTSGQQFSTPSHCLKGQVPQTGLPTAARLTCRGPWGIAGPRPSLTPGAAACQCPRGTPWSQ